MGCASHFVGRRSLMIPLQQRTISSGIRSRAVHPHRPLSQYHSNSFSVNPSKLNYRQLLLEPLTFKLAVLSKNNDSSHQLIPSFSSYSSSASSASDSWVASESETSARDARPGSRRCTASTRAQLTVAVDIDEVLGSFLMALNAFIAEEYFCQHHISEFHVYDFTKVWQCSRTEADLRVHSFFKSEHFDKGILPIPGAHQSLRQIASYCELFVVTSRQNIIKEETLAWIDRHYSGIFRDVHFGNHFALEGESRRKSEICRGVGAQILIDDNPSYAVDCAENGIEVLLFDLNKSYPWSKTRDGPEHPLITRVHSWQEVEEELKGRLRRSNMQN